MLIALIFYSSSHHQRNQPEITFIMFIRTVLATFALTGLLIEAATVTSPSGVIYNCPNVETIEVAYAASCNCFPIGYAMKLMIGPAYSKNMLLHNTGATSTAYYGNSPDNYRVANGDYTLQCIYGGQASHSSIIMSH